MPIKIHHSPMGCTSQLHTDSPWDAMRLSTWLNVSGKACFKNEEDAVTACIKDARAKLKQLAKQIEDNEAKYKAMDAYYKKHKMLIEQQLIDVKIENEN